MTTEGYAPVAVVTRGGTVESVHHGAIAVVDPNGRVIAQVGDPQAVTFARSTIKPIQALPLAAHEGTGELALTDADLAIVSASHSGEPRHVEAVLSLLRRIDCTKEQLECGVHPPLYLQELGQRPEAGAVYTPLQHNCSGKHAGMLALARVLGVPTDGYRDPEHPVQQAIRGALSYATGLPHERIATAVDGCGVPTFALPLARLARAFAWLGSPDEDARYGSAPRRIANAMMAHPGLVAGLKRLDLAVMHTGDGNVVAKGGAEGTQCFALRGEALGVAIKIADGAARAREVVAVEVLRQLGVVQPDVDSPLHRFVSPAVLNSRGETVGDIRPAFELRAP